MARPLTDENEESRRAQPKKTEGERLRERIQSIVLPHALIYACAAADRDAEFLKVERFLDTQTFDASDVPHYIEWGPEDDIEASADGLGTSVLYRPEMFNCDDMRRKERVFFYRARVLARRLGFVGVWCLDDEEMINFIVAYLLADASKREAIPAPFGVIEPTTGLFLNCFLEPSELAGAGARVPITRLEVEWCPPGHEPSESARRRVGNRCTPPGVKVWVYTDSQLAYRYPEAGFLAQVTRAVADAQCPAPVITLANKRVGVPRSGVRSGLGLPFVLPSSPLFDVLAERERLQEAIGNRQQVEGLTIQPHIIMNTPGVKPPAGWRENTTPGDNAMGLGMDAVMHEMNTVQTYTRQEWRRREEELKRLIRPPALYGPGGTEVPSSQAQRMRHGRPHPHETTLDVPEGLALAHVHKPELFTDVDKMQEDYRRSVAEALGVGLAVMQLFSNGGRMQGSGGGKGGGGLEDLFAPSYASDAERQLQHVIQTERNWMSSFFAVLYAKMMHSVDMRMLGEIHDGLRVQKLQMREAKLAARAIEAALTKEKELYDDKKFVALFSTKLAQARTKRERRRLKHHISYYRALIDKLRVCPDAIARLVFQPGTTDHSARQCKVLLQEFYDRGLVDAAQLVPYARAVFGADLKLNTTNPVPPAQRDQLELADAKATADLKREREKIAAAAADDGPPAKKARKT